MTTEEKLLLRIERFCRLVDITPTGFGIKSVNDPSLVSDMRCGRELRAATRNRVEKYMDVQAKKHAKAN